MCCVSYVMLLLFIMYGGIRYMVVLIGCSSSLCVSVCLKKCCEKLCVVLLLSVMLNVNSVLCLCRCCI